MDFEDQSLALPHLIGDTCDQVWFVRDYVMVILEKHTITCNSDPQIEVAGQNYEFPGHGSRDALCTLIERSVKAAVQLDTGTVEIDFGDATILRVSPRPNDVGPEFVYFAERSW